MMLELLEMSRSAIHQYATKFKVDGVSKEDLIGLYSKIKSILTTIDIPEDDTTDIRTIKKNTTLSQMDETKNAIQIAYGTTKGG